MWHEGTKRHRPPWEEALSGSGAGQCTVGEQRNACARAHSSLVLVASLGLTITRYFTIFVIMRSTHDRNDKALVYSAGHYSNLTSSFVPTAQTVGVKTGRLGHFPPL